MPEIKLFDHQPATTSAPTQVENWYAEPFNKRTGCETPGQCSDDCGCDCPYNGMTNTEQLPLIETIAAIFPNEWLAFIIAPAEDDEFEPLHGKLIAHSPHPDDVYDAVNTVLWNQHVYVFFNGDFAALQASYGQSWQQPTEPAGTGKATPPADAAPTATLPESSTALIYRAIDQLYPPVHLSEAIRRLRLARVKAGENQHLAELLDKALDQLETESPPVEDIIWLLEEGLVDTNSI